MSSGPLRVAIVGGGITGLAAAHTFEQARRAGAAIEYRVFEGAPRLGGNVFTERRDGFVVEHGPDGFVANKPHAAELARAVGLGARLVETIASHRRTYVVHRGTLVPFPEGMALAAPTKIGPIIRTPLLTWRGKARMALDLVLPPRRDGHDESMYAFIRRRLGREAAERFAEPLMAGIYAGDPDTLSIRSTFPQLVEQEARYGGLIRAALANRRARGPRVEGAPPPSAFLSLAGGMGELIDGVAAALTASWVHTGTAVRAIEREGRGWNVKLFGGENYAADHVLLAIPAHLAAPIVEPHDPDTALALREVPHVSTATAMLAYTRAHIPHPLDATGFVVPRGEGLPITASTWASSKWPDRAPTDGALLRVFFGGAHAPEMAERSDDELTSLARTHLAVLLGVRAEPRFVRIVRYRRASPQPTLGHGDRIRRVQARLAAMGNVRVAGGGYEGVGIPDCVKQGQAAAAKVLDAHRGGA